MGQPVARAVPMAVARRVAVARRMPMVVPVIVPMGVLMRVGVLVPVAHVDPLPVRARVDVPVPWRHYVRMSARMHLSSAHDAHPRSPGEEQFALAAELLALLGDRTRLALLHALPGRPSANTWRGCASRAWWTRARRAAG